MINVRATLISHNESGFAALVFIVGTKTGKCLMTNEEKTSLTAACTRWRTSGNTWAATTSGSRFRALALPTAVSDSAVQFTRLAASGMIGNQRLEHSGEPRGRSFGSDTLGGNPGALA
jgi:hypothetical protein